MAEVNSRFTYKLLCVVLTYTSYGTSSSQYIINKWLNTMWTAWKISDLCQLPSALQSLHNKCQFIVFSCAAATLFSDWAHNWCQLKNLLYTRGDSLNRPLRPAGCHETIRHSWLKTVNNNTLSWEMFYSKTENTAELLVNLLFFYYFDSI